MFKLIIFDLDGTLLDTIEDIANSTNHALACFHFPTHPLEAFRFFIGNGVNKLLERALPEDKRDSDSISMLKHEFVKHYFAHADECTKPYPGIENLLQQLADGGYQLAVASNKMHDATVELVKKYFPEIPFTAIFGQREGVPVKPHPVVLEEIISLAGVTKNEVLYVGDSGVDAATAYNARVAFTGVLWGFRPRKEFEEAGVTSFAQTSEQLAEIIFSKRCQTYQFPNL